MSLLHWMLRASPLVPLAALPLVTAGTAGRPVLSAVRDAPSLTSPAAVAVIAPNDQGKRCAPDGITSSVDFNWSPVARAVGYELIIEGEGEDATGPFSFHSLVKDTRQRYTKCHTSLPDMKRYRWQWRVRGLDAQLRPGPWSAPGKLRYD